MRQLFLIVNDGSVRLIETPAPTVKDNYVIVETEYSIVSTGTERSITSFGEKNLLEKALERPEQVKKIVEKISTDGIITTIGNAFTRLEEPLPLGYSGVGIVRACGRNVTEVAVGDCVAMVGQAYHAEVNRVNRNMIAKIPNQESDYRQYALCALGGIALQGIHQACVSVGDTVAVIGLGLIGHVVARILDAYGCDVIAYDVVDKSIPKTKLKAFVLSNDDNAANITRSLTMGRGVDKVIIAAATNSNDPIDLASTIVRDRGVICMIGVTKINIDRQLFYKRELTFTIARSYGPGRYDSSYEENGVDYPIGYVRYTQGRNIEEFVRLVSQRRVDFSDLITHVIPFEEAPKAYEMITTNPNQEKYIGIILQYSNSEKKWDSVINNEKKKTDKSKINIGLIGAGNFSKNSILPIMKSTGLFHLKALATTGGIGAAQASNSFTFDYTTNDYKKMLSDSEIDLIIISTNHNTHAKFLVEALEAGKNVYCEKPLCLSLDELNIIEEAYQKSDKELFCGLNRRYAPLIQKIKKELTTDKIPAVYNYIVNAGYIDEKHWTQDELIGGGRIIGEAFHYIDTIQYLDGSELTNVDIRYAKNDAFPKKDNALISLEFSSGAVGSIIYTSMGSKKYPKEKLYVFSNGAVYEMNNYISMYRYGSVKSKIIKIKQDKGIMNEYISMFNIIIGKNPNSQINDVFKASRLVLSHDKL